MAMVHKMVGRPTQLGEVRSRGVPTQATVASVRTSLPTIKQATDPSAGRVVSSVCPIPAMVPQPRVQTGPVRRGGALNAFGLSTLVSNAVRMLPLFYSDTATIEKPQDFRELFEAHTVGLSNQSRLFVFRQKLTGREAERWWNDTTITTFKTLKVRFHNPFLSRMTDEVRERLETTKRERGESVEEWGLGSLRVTELPESSDEIPTVPSRSQQQANVCYAGC
ncbi:hypothetical protein PC129_g11433 [Phytophthora cactorum]|uniref:Uncharacterized protein n=1 Tax=Phytophthora cactorum TaxID=29920 RepID=A0A8T1KHZ8_9STRA|nr:hypothetical protein PC111_g19092 [Phytophthora cactorum]KAG3134862.1 hypothetical protein C6341_g21993 [Phytophthora cactorum]KAG3217746.1 hypothetical protein PC129_g11433 [Phytophthora cactorum]KAG4050906.1 hypothetical protein PC123_g13856 [Phytophthora cactorum]KAG4236317.1 hypothetical protein PC116_g15602 [Phytophthora cactorum]